MTRKKASIEVSWLKEYMDKVEQMAVVFPALTNLAVNHPEDFRGMTCFRGDGNDVVVGMKRWSDDGKPEVIWSSGDDFLRAMMNMDKALKAGKWRVDKRSK